jgi:beta-glucosidase
VTFTLGPDELAMIDRRMQRVVEPGRFDVMVGTSATTTLSATLDVR